MIWLSVLLFLTSLPPIGGLSYVVYLHIILGIVVLGVAYNNNVIVRKTDCPSRIKRITKATFSLSILQLILGVLLYLLGYFITFGIPFIKEIIQFIHLMTSLAIITQVSSAATSYDMWEEKEFTQEQKVS